tara:strand:+ start:4927 stop:6813 length:1887 start_codon:yes stop_codon:yes gene_type:complete
MQLFVVSDFSVINVVQNSNAFLPFQYKVAATWGSHEGSFLLWVLMLACWTAAVAIFAKDHSDRFHIRVIAILFLLQAAFLLYLIFASNPFTRILPAPLSGNDLNPLLQDPFMVIHPPMLYMGYVGFAVCFSLAVSALLDEELSSKWASSARLWANLAWSFLTLGILLGSWWAYRELGWGGWWFWDPVENASLMPWFAGTALMHSLAVTAKRDTLKSWSILLAITAFAFSLLGTFLVRSGVLTSVHSFASDPTRGVFILIMLSVIVGAALILYALKTTDLKNGGAFSPVSKESLLLVNNIIMSASLAVVMLGTLYPLIAEVITSRKMSVGPPYFNTVITPILLPALFFMSLAPRILWRESEFFPALKKLVVPSVVAVFLALIFLFLIPTTSVLTALGIIGAIILLLGTITSVIDRVETLRVQAIQNQNLGLISLPSRIGKLGLSYWGMVVAHCGLAIFSLGVIFVMSYQIEKDISLKPNQTEEISGYSLTFLGVRPVSGVNYSGIEGIFELTKKDRNTVYVLTPEKRKYFRSDDPMTEAAIRYGLFGDFYVSLGDPPDGTAVTQESSWSVRVSYKPLMVWVWFGCLLMAIGGFLGSFGHRLKNKNYNEKQKSISGSSIDTQPGILTKNS